MLNTHTTPLPKPELGFFDSSMSSAGVGRSKGVGSGQWLALRTDDHPRSDRVEVLYHPRSSTSDKGREVQRRGGKGKQQGVRLRCEDTLYPLLIV